MVADSCAHTLAVFAKAGDVFDRDADPMVQSDICMLKARLALVQMLRIHGPNPSPEYTLVSWH